MKIGILTQPLINNYGGILQNYALQTVLKRLGHTVFTLNIVYSSNWIKRIKSMSKRVILRLLGKKVRIRIWATDKETEFISKNTLKFINKHIKTTPIIKQITELDLKDYKFDVFIVGSDQVWRPQYSPHLLTYYLDFLNNNNKVKKIAYAASFGVDKWEYTSKMTKKCADLIKKFDAISVREDSALQLIEKHFNAHAVKVLDPTLLLDKEDYINLLGKSENYKEEILYTYILDKNNEKEKIVNKVADKYNLIISSGMPESNFIDFEKRDLCKCVFPPIESWLEGFMKAKFVITDSFHGTIFSIILNKPFLTIVNTGRGKTRLTSLLKQFHLHNRLIQSVDDISKNYIGEIDWLFVNSILKEEKEKSIDFIINNIK
ncbi:MAG: polysaccharide pyruvyl transferase family protein [Tissierellia bacterium]|nr:polysaccharide pyruvyl transferase family protein [Tissierellia bacterium]